jgi:NADPH:quinone reductase-like Zn-dependent oxidoreductase
VKRGGVIVSLVARPDESECLKRGIHGSSLWSHPDARELDEIAKLIENKKIRPVVTQVLPLEEAKKADEQAETHHTRGKIVLRVNPEADRP